MKKQACALVLAVFAMLAWFPTSSEAGSYMGRFCFQLAAYADLWVWEVTDVGGGAFQVTGHDVYNGPGAMNGGGRTLGTRVIFAVKEESPDSAIHGTHAISLSLATLSGTTDLVWVNSQGVPFATYTNLAFSLVTCPAFGPEEVAPDNGQPTTSGR